MKDETVGIIALLVLLFLIASSAFLLIQNFRLKQEEKNLNDMITHLNKKIGEYQATEDFYWDFMNLLDEVYDSKVKEAVLEERVYWLKYLSELQEENVTQEYYKLYVNQLKDDMELLVEVIVDYYEDTNQSVTLEEYTAQNYPALYERILGY